MKSAIRASAVLGVSSGVSAIFGLITAKASAAFLGPAGVGLVGLLQALLSLAQLVGGLGISASLVRFGAPAAAREDFEEVALLRRAGWVIVTASAVSVSVILCLGRHWIAARTLGIGRTNYVLWVAATLFFSLGFTLYLGVVNAHHQVQSLATLSILSSAGGCMCAVIFYWLQRERAIPVVMLASAIVQFVIAWAIACRLPRANKRPALLKVYDRVGTLVRFGIPYTASALAGSGAQLVLPIAILALLNTRSVGYFRASFTFSTSYLGLVLVAMAQDYFPRLSASGKDDDRINQIVNEQFRLLMMLGVPLVLMALACAPQVVTLVYSKKFMPAVAVLQWQLLGDLFKFAAWTMTFAVLARAPSTWFLLMEICGGGALLASIAYSIRRWGLPGIGIGYLVAYVLYTVIAALTLRRFVNFRISNRNLVLFGVALAFALLIRILVRFNFAGTGISLGVIPALVYCAFSCWILIREVSIWPRRLNFRKLAARKANNNGN